MKQTAVDYLYQKLWDETKDKWTWYGILMDAKEMEKSNLLRYGSKCFIHGMLFGLSSAILGMLISKFI
jgi:hypothetical protein